jgi:hypothetical protein
MCRNWSACLLCPQFRKSYLRNFALLATCREEKPQISPLRYPGFPVGFRDIAEVLASLLPSAAYVVVVSSAK